MIALLALGALAAETSVTVEVVGALADVEVRRRFVNPLDQPIDVLLELPVPPDAALDRFTLRVADRVVQSQVDTAGRAAVRYAQAAAEGRIAGLLEEDEPSIVTQRIANVPARAQVELEVHLVQTVDRRDGVWEVRLPLAIAPRFTVDGPGDLVAERASDLDVQVAVHAGLPLSWLSSPSHPSVGTLAGLDGALSLDGVAADRDLVVRWAVAGVEPQVAAWHAEGHGLVIIEPPADEVPISTPPQDVIFLVDTSESTAGVVAEQLVQALAVLLRELRPDDRFTLLAFDDVVRGVAVRELATWEAIAKAEAELARLPVGGGTRMAEALRFALAVPAPPEQPRTVVVLSDAAVGDEFGVLQAQLASRPATVHTVAFGSAANHWLLGELAHLGGGVAAAVGEDVEAGLEPVIAALAGPVLTDLQVTWGGALVQPDPPPALFAGQAMRFVTDQASADPVQVSGLLAGSPWQATAWPREVPDARLVALSYAEWRLAELERAEDRGAAVAAEGQALALRYQVASRWTSLVAVDGLITNPGGEVVMLEMPAEPVGGTYSLDGANIRQSATTAGQEVPTAATAADDYSGPPPPAALGWVPDAAPMAGDVLVGGLDDGRVRLHHLDRTDPLSLLLQPRLPWLARPRAYNDVEAEVAAHGVLASGPLPGGAGRAAGPIVRDRLFLTASVAGDQRRLGSTEAGWIAGSGALTWQRARSEVTASVTGDSGTASIPDDSTTWGGVAGTAEAVIWPGGGQEITLVAGGSRHRWGESEADQQQVVARASGVSDDARFELELGAARRRWLAFDALHLPAGAQLVTEGDRGELGASMRGDVLLSDGALLGLPAPSLWGAVQLAPFARLEAGGARQTSPELALPRHISGLVAPRRWTAWTGLELEVGPDLTLWTRVTGTHEAFPFVASPLAAELVPAFDIRREVATVETGLRKTWTRRWRLDLRHAWTAPQPTLALAIDPRAPFVPGFLDPLRRHRVGAYLGWDLPTDPWTTRLVLDAAWQSGIGARGAPWLAPVVLGTAGLSQAIDLPEGAIWLDAGVTVARNAPGAFVVPLEAQVLLGAPPIEPPWRLQGAVRYSF